MLAGFVVNVSEEVKPSQPKKYNKLSCLGQGGGGSVALQEDHFSHICTKVWGKQPDGGVSSRVPILKDFYSLPNSNMFPTVVDFMDR